MSALCSCQCRSAWPAAACIHPLAFCFVNSVSSGSKMAELGVLLQTLQLQPDERVLIFCRGVQSARAVAHTLTEVMLPRVHRPLHRRVCRRRRAPYPWDCRERFLGGCCTYVGLLLHLLCSRPSCASGWDPSRMCPAPQDGIPAACGCAHGKMPEHLRQSDLAAFTETNPRLPFLVTTDLNARGLDFPNVSAVTSAIFGVLP